MKQLTIVASDRVGLLADVSYILGKSHINMDTVSAAAAGGKAFVIIGLSDAARAAQLLRANQYEVIEADMLVLKLSDKPGELAAVSKTLTDAGISVHNMTILAKGEGVAFYAAQVDKLDTARKLLKHYLDFEK